MMEEDKEDNEERGRRRNKENKGGREWKKRKKDNEEEDKEERARRGRRLVHAPLRTLKGAIVRGRRGKKMRKKRKKRKKENEGGRRGGRRRRINKWQSSYFIQLVLRCSSVSVHWCDAVSRISNNFLFLSALNLFVVVVVVVFLDVLRGRAPSVTQSIGNLKAPAGKSSEYKQQMK